jgi:dCTP deaminase
MSLLSYSELCDLVNAGIIQGSNYDLVNSASVDIRLGNKLLVEKQELTLGGLDGETIQVPTLFRVELDKKGKLTTREYDLIRDGDFVLGPGEFILAQSMEVFNLPNNISAEYKLKSSMARIGLEHLNAGWCDAGWNGSVLTLELKNMTRNHDIVLKAGDKIGQVVFFKHEPVPDQKSYAVRGSYNGDKEVTGVKVKSQFPEL